MVKRNFSINREDVRVETFIFGQFCLGKSFMNVPEGTSVSDKESRHRKTHHMASCPTFLYRQYPEQWSQH